MGSRGRWIGWAAAAAALAVLASPQAAEARALGLSAFVRSDGRTVVLRWPSQAPAHVTLTREPGGRTVAGPGSLASSALDRVRDDGRTYTWTLRVAETGATASISLSTRPAPPLGLAVSSAGGRLRLHWAPALDPDVVRVTVRRSGGGSARPACPDRLRAGRGVGGSARRSLQDDGATRAWRDYCYAVFAVDRHGNVSTPATLRAMRPGDVAGLSAVAGCKGALLRWSSASVPGFARVRIVRNARRVPLGPGDGRAVRHHRGALVDGRLHHFTTYHYRVFGVLRRRGRRPLYSPGITRSVHTGRVCAPRNGERISDRTPRLGWLRYRRAFRYAVVLRLGPRTVLARFTSHTSYQVRSSWRYHGRSRHLRAGHTYALYVYAYTSRRPNGFLIGRSTFRERRG